MGLSVSVFGESLYPLAEQWQWQQEQAEADVHLRTVDNRLSISLPNVAILKHLKPTNFRLDGISIQPEYGAGLKQALVRACGLHKRKSLRICDACAGTGSDAFILAHYGGIISSFERNPIVYALVHDTFQQDAGAIEWQLSCTDVCDALQQNSDYNVIYVDPMFQLEKRKAAERKEMKILSYLEQQSDFEDDAVDLLQTAAATAIPRLVIKRAMKMPVESFPNRQHTHSIKGKGFRLDVYQLI